MDIHSIVARWEEYQTNPAKYIRYINADNDGYFNGKMIPFSEVIEKRVLGSGRFSMVVEYSDDMVLKLNTREADAAYEFFINFVSKRPASPHFPKLYEKHNLSGGYTAFVLEKLEMGLEEERDTILEHLENNWRSIKRKEFYRDSQESNNRFNLINPFFGEEFKRAVSILNDCYVEARNTKNLCEISTDFHACNVMIRASDNMPVITDPFVCYK